MFVRLATICRKSEACELAGKLVAGSAIAIMFEPPAGIVYSQPLIASSRKNDLRTSAIHHAAGVTNVTLGVDWPTQDRGVNSNDIRHRKTSSAQLPRTLIALLFRAIFSYAV